MIRRLGIQSGAMRQTHILGVIYSAGLVLAGMVIGHAWPSAAHAQTSNRVFELRTYTAVEGKLPALNARFRDHTMKLFEKHGMTNIGYWTPQDAPLSQNTLIYIIAHQSREAAKKNWADFNADPDWQKARAESETNAGGGRLTTKTESVFLDPTEYSPIK
jgi:NIPSNAP